MFWMVSAIISSKEIQEKMEKNKSSSKAQWLLVPYTAW
jgi:hypothetical protein